MVDEELKDEGILIDGKEAKRQFLEELRSKNEEESRKAEEEKNNQNNDDEEEKKQFLEEVRKNVENKKVEDKKTNEDYNLDVEDKDIVDNDDESKGETSEGKVDNDDQGNSEISEDKASEKNKEENVDIALVGSDSTEKKGKNFFDGTAKASLTDTALTAVVSVLGVYIFDLLLRIFGYYVVDFKGVYIILFLIILVLYPIIMHHSKQGKTLGQKIGKMEVKEREE